MIWFAAFLLLIVLTLSALFIGIETGFYRVSRVRLVLDAMQRNDPMARRLLYLTNHPALFIATALVGNNAANYLTSLAIVLLTKGFFGAGMAAEIGASVCFSPVIFVYGELLPKYLFFHAPGLLLRATSPAFMFFAILFAPLSALLWALGWLLERLCGQSPARIRLALARQELGDVLMEGRDAGILQPTQLQLSQNFFMVATRPVSEWMTPVNRLAPLFRTATRHEALQQAQRLRQTEMVVADERTGELAGYLRTIEMIVDTSNASLTTYINPLLEIPHTYSHGAAIMQMQTSGELMARVVDEQGQTLGVVTLDALTEPLLSDVSQRG
ncbi:MAG: CNNM domain-containing protein [Pirellulaceae bacterium]